MKLLLLPQNFSVYRESCLYYSPITNVIHQQRSVHTEKIAPFVFSTVPQHKAKFFPKIVHSDAVLEIATNTVTFVT